MSGITNYLKVGDINRSTRSCEIVDYLPVILSTDTMEMFTRWPTITVSCHECVHPPGVIK